MMRFSTVDLPEPFRPSTPILAPGKKDNDTLLEDLSLGRHRLGDAVHRKDVLGHGLARGRGGRKAAARALGRPGRNGGDCLRRSLSASCSAAMHRGGQHLAGLRARQAVPALDQRGQVLRRHWPGDQEALHGRTTDAAQHFQLGRLLDTLGQRVHAQHAGQFEHGAHDRPRIAGLHQLAYEGAVDLQLVERETGAGRPARNTRCRSRRARCARPVA